MVATILHPRRRHRTPIELNPTLEHLLDTIKSLRPIFLRRRIRLLLDHIAYRNDLAIFVRRITTRVIITNPPQTDYTNLQHRFSPF